MIFNMTAGGETDASDNSIKFMYDDTDFGGNYFVTVRFRKPGTYTVEAVSTDLNGRATSSWKSFTAGTGVTWNDPTAVVASANATLTINMTASRNGSIWTVKVTGGSVLFTDVSLSKAS